MKSDKIVTISFIYKRSDSITFMFHFDKIKMGPLVNNCVTNPHCPIFSPNEHYCSLLNKFPLQVLLCRTHCFLTEWLRSVFKYTYIKPVWIYSHSVSYAIPLLGFIWKI